MGSTLLAGVRCVAGAAVVVVWTVGFVDFAVMDSHPATARGMAVVMDKARKSDLMEISVGF